MKIQKIILINSAIIALGNKYVKTVNYACYPPLGLLTIASRVKINNPNIDIKIIDAEIINLNTIKETIKDYEPDLIGISVLTPTYETGLLIAQYAKQCSVPYVVLGNDHASFFPELILKNRDFIDFVIRGDNGDIDLNNLVTAINSNTDPFTITNNLFGRKNNIIVSSPSLNLPLSERIKKVDDLPNYDLLDNQHKEVYFNSYNNDFGYFHSKSIIPITINNAAGCNNGKRHCLYCSIYDLKPQWGKAELFWEAVKKYSNENSVNLFFEVCDNFGGLHRYRKELIATMPKWYEASDFEMIVYSRAFDIYSHPEMIEDFKKLHIKRVIIGLEAGNNDAIKQMRKGHPAGKEKLINTFAVEKLAEANIQLHSSFIYGTLGETQESIDSTKEFIRWLKTFENVASIEVSPLYPLPTSPSWDLLLGISPSKFYGSNVNEFLKETGLPNYKKGWEIARELFTNSDLIDNKLACEIWLEYFTFLGFKLVEGEVIETNREIKLDSHINIGAFL